MNGEPRQSISTTPLWAFETFLNVLIEFKAHYTRSTEASTGLNSFTLQQPYHLNSQLFLCLSFHRCFYFFLILGLLSDFIIHTHGKAKRINVPKDKHYKKRTTTFGMSFISILLRFLNRKLSKLNNNQNSN